MATVRATVTRAMRKLRLVASGDEPTAAELADGVAVVQGIFDAWAAGGMFGRLDRQLGNASAYEPVVLLWESLPGDTSVELPVRLRDPETGDTVPPADLSYIEVVDETTGVRKAYLWDARKAAWGRVDALTADSAMPLSGRSAEGLAAVVATRLAEEFGQSPGPWLVREAGGFLQAMATRYGETRETTQADYF